MTTTVFPSFRDFAKQDFQLYAGVESKAPRIVDIEEEAFGACLTIIQDGKLVHLNLFADDESNEWHSCEYPCEATAEAVAVAMLALVKTTLDAAETNSVCDACEAIVERFSLTLV